MTLYISNFQRPITERLSKDFFNDPSSASVGCAKTGKIQIADNIATGKGGEVSFLEFLVVGRRYENSHSLSRSLTHSLHVLQEVFEESRSLLFKSLRVQRIYDQDNDTMIYVSFNTRLDKNSDANKSRFSSSLCAVNLK